MSNEYNEFGKQKVDSGLWVYLDRARLWVPAAVDDIGRLQVVVDSLPGVVLLSGQVDSYEVVRPEGYSPAQRRTIAAVDGVNPPLVGDANFIVNDAFDGAFHKSCLFFVNQTLTGGTNPSTVVRPYVRNNGPINGIVGGLESVALVGSVKRAIQVDCLNQDVLLWLEVVNGAPAPIQLLVDVVWL